MWTSRSGQKPVRTHTLIIAKKRGNFKRFGVFLRNRKIFTRWTRMWTGCLRNVYKKRDVERKKKRVHPKRSEKGNGGKVVHQTANIVEKARTGFRQTVEKKKDV